MTQPGLRSPDGYLPIAGYGLIGDCRSAALVGRDGSIDWLALPRFDDDPIFGRLLDARRGGHWQIAPTGSYSARQRYRDLTNILDTIFTTPTGVVVLTDFMPVEEDDLKQHARLHQEPRIIRIVECLAGRVTVRHEFQPVLNFGAGCPEFEIYARHIHCELGPLHLRLISSASGQGADGHFTLNVGEAVAFGLRAGKPGARHASHWSVERARSMLRVTQDFWWRWVGQVRYSGPYTRQVYRSALCLKLMTYTPTGAIIAAPTTSLPERIGGTRNWDYRFTWLRDASFTLFAFFQLGLTDEAHAFFRWMTHLHRDVTRRLPNLFDLDGHANINEIELRHVDGYRRSRPVRIGNGAVDQLQLDVYGEVMDSAYLYARFGDRIPRALWMRLREIVELAIKLWEQPDSSIWEVRSEQQQYTYSKLMCWVAVDRGLRLAQRFQHPHDAARWKAARRAMHRRITAEAYSRRFKAFAQTLNGNELDAAVLRMSQVRFLDDHDPRLVSTIRAIERHLSEGVLVRRYDTRRSKDGLPGDEGAFFMTSFWLADALAHVGDLEGAQRRFERLIDFSSPLGLFSEEVDSRTGELLGNFPQAFTHLALVGAAVNIERARRGQIGVRGLQ